MCAFLENIIENYSFDCFSFIIKNKRDWKGQNDLKGKGELKVWSFLGSIQGGEEEEEGDRIKTAIEEKKVLFFC